MTTSHTSNGSAHQVRPVSTSIVELKPLSKAEAQKYKDAESSKFEQLLKIFRSLFGECIARLIQLVLCGFSLWRLIMSAHNTLPEWVYVIICLGACASLIDGGVSLYYYFHMPSYWKCYGYFHWKGRKWFDLNTFYCILTIGPTIFLTEMVMYNNSCYNHKISSTEAPSSLTTTDTNTSDITTVAPQDDLQLWCRDITLHLLHNAICVALPLVRLQVRGPDSVDRISLNTFVYELMLNAADLNNLITEGVALSFLVQDWERSFFIATLVLWGIGVVIPCLLVSDRCYTRIVVTKWSKLLDIVYASLIVLFQDCIRLFYRTVLIVMLMSSGRLPQTTCVVFWAGKNAVSIIFYVHRVFAVVKQS